MRKLFAVTTICLGLAQMQAAFAQAPRGRDYEETASQTPSPRLSLAQQHLYQRASYEARERTLRLEACKWQGYSPSRPNVYQVDFNDIMVGRGRWDRYHPSHPIGSPWFYRPW